MKLEDLSKEIVDQLYSALTGGSADLPLPQNVVINWIQGGIPFHESAFDWAIAGPYAGPTPLTLDYFRELVEAFQPREGDPPRGDGFNPLEEAKIAYQQHLLGSWEQWSRLVDFIPLINPAPEDTTVKASRNTGKYNKASLVYAQSGQRLSEVYLDTLKRCYVADEQPTEHQQKILERMRALLYEEVETEDFLTGETKVEPVDSRVLQAYGNKRTEYENSVLDYASRAAKANDSVTNLREWSRSGGIYKRRALDALNNWIATGYKNEVERAYAAINHITGSSMLTWKNLLQQNVENAKNTLGTFDQPFFPASVIPGSFARSEGWTKFEERNLERKVNSSTRTRSGGGGAKIGFGLFSFGGSGSGEKKEVEYSFEQSSFSISFEFTQVEISRPAFNPNFFLSRGWKPKDEFVRDHGRLHSNGETKPEGAMIGYPTKALFIRNLTIESSEFASFMRTKESEIKAGASFGWGPFSVGGKYNKSDTEKESNFSSEGSTITVKGMQLVGFVSALFPYTANPSPEVENWV